MDVDWCLTCEKRVEAPNLYCSQDCRYLAASTSTLLDQDEDDQVIIFHPIDDISSLLDTPSRWTGNDPAGISAWAAEIPYGQPAESSGLGSSPSYSAYRPPQLLSPNPRIVPPSLCKNTPKAIPPLSTPLQTSKPPPMAQPSDTSRISFKSALTESSLATPASSHPMPISTTHQPLGLGGIYSHVRSWVTPSPSLVQFKRATSPVKVKLTPSVRNARSHPVKVVSPSDTPLGFLDDDTVHWKASTILLEQPHIKRPSEHQQPRARRLPHELSRLADQDPSFRARGRKASRAVA